jgi:hypothetical protein
VIPVRLGRIIWNGAAAILVAAAPDRLHARERPALRRRR